MIKIIWYNFIRFVFVIFIQIALINNIQVNSYLNAYIYVLFILLLPFETPKWLMLILAFFTGLTMDFFLDTGGAHAAATTLMAFSRPTILKVVSARRDYEPGIRPIIKDLGFRWFFSYALIMVSIHHVSLFFIEVFKFSEMIYTLFRALLSISFTLILLIISQYLFVKRD